MKPTHDGHCVAEALHALWRAAHQRQSGEEHTGGHDGAQNVCPMGQANLKQTRGRDYEAAAAVPVNLRGQRWRREGHSRANLLVARYEDLRGLMVQNEDVPKQANSQGGQDGRQAGQRWLRRLGMWRTHSSTLRLEASDYAGQHESAAQEVMRTARERMWEFNVIDGLSLRTRPLA